MARHVMQRRLVAPRPVRSTQRGVFALAVGLLTMPLLGFAALALDGGRLFLNRAEMQNAADACALAAAQQLANASLPSNAFIRATGWGNWLAEHHKVDFQDFELRPRFISVKFSFKPDATEEEWQDRNTLPTDPSTYRYVRCRIQRDAVDTWLLRVAGINLFSMQAQAIAWSVSNGSNNCGLPATPSGKDCKKMASLVQ